MQSMQAPIDASCDTPKRASSRLLLASYCSFLHGCKGLLYEPSKLIVAKFCALYTACEIHGCCSRAATRFVHTCKHNARVCGLTWCEGAMQQQMQCNMSKPCPLKTSQGPTTSACTAFAERRTHPHPHPPDIHTHVCLCTQTLIHTCAHTHEDKHIHTYVCTCM